MLITIFITSCAACRGRWATATQPSCSAQRLLLGATVLQPVADALLPLPLPQLAQFLLPHPHLPPPPPPWGLPTRPVTSQPHLKLSLPPPLRPPLRPLLRPQQPPAPPHPPPSSTQAPHQVLLPSSPQAVSSQSLLECQLSHLHPLHPQSPCFTQGSSQVQHPQLQLLPPPLLPHHLPLLLLRHLPPQLPQPQLRQQQLYPQVC